MKIKSIICVFSVIISQTSLAELKPHHSKLAARTKEVNKLLEENVLDRKLDYCIKGTLTCRSLYLLKSRTNGNKISSFYNVFSSIERGTGASEYFISNSEEKTTFKASLDEAFDAKVKIDFFDIRNNQLQVTFDQDGLPTIHNVYLIKHGTTKYAIGSLTYTNEYSRLTGYQYDTQNPNEKTALSIEYTRVNAK